MNANDCSTKVPMCMSSRCRGKATIITSPLNLVRLALARGLPVCTVYHQMMLLEQAPWTGLFQGPSRAHVLLLPTCLLLHRLRVKQSGSRRRNYRTSQKRKLKREGLKKIGDYYQQVVAVNWSSFKHGHKLKLPTSRRRCELSLSNMSLLISNRNMSSSESAFHQWTCRLWIHRLSRSSRATATRTSPLVTYRTWTSPTIVDCLITDQECSPPNRRIQERITLRIEIATRTLDLDPTTLITLHRSSRAMTCQSLKVQGLQA